MKRIYGLAFGLALVSARAHAGDDVWVLSDSNAKVTHDCGKQPVVAINASADQVTLIGACTKVSVNGGRTTLVAEAVGAIAIHGAGNSVTLGAVARIALTGAENKVTWKAAVGGKKPQVSDLGSGNTVTQIVAPK